MEQQNNENQLNVELSAEVAEGIYSNLAIISHSSSEFVLDFVRIMPGAPKANVKSRIILTPEHAKRLLLPCRIILLNTNSSLEKSKRRKTV